VDSNSRIRRWLFLPSDRCVAIIDAIRDRSFNWGLAFSRRKSVGPRFLLDPGLLSGSIVQVYRFA
jgi:hypothetical protein